MKKMGAWVIDSRKIFWACFLAGVLAGTIAGNIGILEQFGIANELRNSNNHQNLAVRSRPWRMQKGSQEKFLYICRQRMGEGAAGWLLGLTVCSSPFFWGLAGYMGFSLSWIVSQYTAELGILGLPGFFLSCFPQWFFYLPAWWLFIWMGLKKPVRVRMVPALLALLLLGIGAGAEAFFNPFFAGLL